MSKKILIIVGSVIVVVAAAVGVFLGLNANNGSDSSKSKETIKIEAPKEEAVVTVDSLQKQAAEMFPDVKAIGDFSKQDVQDALLTSNMYASAAYNNPYFIQGRWVEEDLSISGLDNSLRKFLSNNGQAVFVNSVETFNTATDKETRMKAWDFLYANMNINWFKDTKYSATDACLEKVSFCTQDYNISDMKYDLSPQGDKIKVDFVVSITNFAKDTSTGQEVSSKRTYTVQHVLSPNVDKVQGNYSFLIDELYSGMSQTSK